MSSEDGRNESGSRLDADSDIETAVTSGSNLVTVGGNSKEMTDGQPLRKNEPSADLKVEPEGDPVVEELSIQSSKARRLARLSRIALIGAAVLVVVAVIVGVGVWGYGRFRQISVSVNGTEKQVSANTTLGKLLTDNGDFKAKPGRLLSVSGKVLKSTGGEAVACKINGQKVAADSNVNKVKLSENDKITVENGSDLTEDHDVTSSPIPFNVVMNGHGVIQKLKQRGVDGVSEAWKGKISGEQVNKGVIKNPQDLVVDTFSPRPEGRNVIALTFDDGPSQYSAQILDILKGKGVKATFFDVGQHSAAEPQMEQRMVAEGHQVASHSNTHADMFKLNPQQLQGEISQSLDNIKKASGVTTKMMRAPYGNFGADQWRYAGDLIDCNVIWSIDTLDWKLPGAQAISDAVLSKAYNGAVVLMHDGGGDRTQDVEALPGIIDGLKAQGYEFVTIDELMAMNGNQ
jgi:peptidoglycan-N-acetylglucosamine deacetylase